MRATPLFTEKPLSFFTVHAVRFWKGLPVTIQDSQSLLTIKVYCSDHTKAEQPRFNVQGACELVYYKNSRPRNVTTTLTSGQSIKSTIYPNITSHLSTCFFKYNIIKKVK